MVYLQFKITGQERLTFYMFISNFLDSVIFFLLFSGPENDRITMIFVLAVIVKYFPVSISPAHKWKFLPFRMYKHYRITGAL